MTSCHFIVSPWQQECLSDLIYTVDRLSVPEGYNGKGLESSRSDLAPEVVSQVVLLRTNVNILWRTLKGYVSLG
jgi:hypothetical protein